MKRISPILLVIILLAAGMTGSLQSPTRRITRQVLEDKIRGGWAGQMIGVSYGAPTEFNYLGKIIEREIPWSPERVENSLHQDDLYVDMTLAEVLDRAGLDATTEQYGEAFKETKYPLWHANASARRNLNRGLKAPLSGHPRYNVHANDIDFQIEADFIGLMTPGLPQIANDFADRVGHVMNYGDGVYGGMFVSGMYAAAFFETDPHRIVELGLACLPARSGYAQTIGDLLALHQQYPNDWKEAWRRINEKWDRDDPCTEGAMHPFNIDARLNGAYVALGLLYGDGDFGRTIEISTRAGQDSDCNPASAAGVLGVVLGYDKIPNQWKGGIPAIAEKKFDFTNLNFNEIAQATLKRALQLVEKAGGKVSGDEIVIPVQRPKAARLEQWSPGIPEKILTVNDPAWQWQGQWQSEEGKGRRLAAKNADGAGSEVNLTFTGKSVVLIGRLFQTGGRADVWLDGKKADPIDAWIPERTNDDDLWRVYDLKPGKHTLRIVTRDDADPRSRGKRVQLQGAIVYR